MTRCVRAVALALSCFVAARAAAEEWSVASRDQRTTITLSLNDGHLAWRVVRTGAIILDNSPRRPDVSRTFDIVAKGERQ